MPRWVKGVVGFDRALGAALRVRAAARDALLLGLLDPEARAATTAWLYASQSTYLPGGAAFARGFFAWEREALAQMQLRPGARLLVGGAGGGRELAALAGLGFEAVGFDPSPGLVGEVAGRLPPGVRLVRGAYADLCEAVGGRGGPLAEVVAEGPFDAAICGWGSLSHVVGSEARREVLEALRRVVTGPVLVSTVLPPRHTGRAGQVFAGVSALLRAVGAPGRPEPGSAYVEGVGFVVRVDLEALDALAREAGWVRVWGAQGSNCHAVYTPSAAPSPAG